MFAVLLMLVLLLTLIDADNVAAAVAAGSGLLVDTINRGRGIDFVAGVVGSDLLSSRGR